MNNTTLKIFFNICFLVYSVDVFAQVKDYKDAYAIYFENDSRNIGGPGSDQAYTNGFKFSYIYAPNDTQATNLIVDERSYAAWLYLGFAVSLKAKSTEHFLELDLGTIGPSALGEQVQNGFHSLIGTNKANGWSNEFEQRKELSSFASIGIVCMP